MRRAKSHINSKPKITVYDDPSSSSSDQPVPSVFSHQEHGRPGSRVNRLLSPTTSDTFTLDSKLSISSSLCRLRGDFDEIKCKMKIFGESLNLCRCIADDYQNKLNSLERRLESLEKGHFVGRSESNYSAIIQKNRKLSHKTHEDAKFILDAA